MGEEHAKSYTSLIAVVVESAAVYAVVALVFIVAYWRNSYVQNLALPVMAQVMVRFIYFDIFISIVAEKINVFNVI